MATSGYRRLEVWLKGRTLAVQVFRMTSAPEFSHEWALRDQMRRAAISVPSNIAEGSRRGSNRDSIRFFYMARGSAAELSTQMDIAQEVGIVDAGRAEEVMQECASIEAMLMGLIAARGHHQPT